MLCFVRIKKSLKAVDGEDNIEPEELAELPVAAVAAETEDARRRSAAFSASSWRWISGPLVEPRRCSCAELVLSDMSMKPQKLSTETHKLTFLLYFPFWKARPVSSS